MVFNPKALQVELATGSTGPGQARFFRRATYITPDAAAVVEAAGYFNAAAARLPKNTVIQAVMAADGTPVLKHYVVTVNSGATVTVAVQTVATG